MTAGYHCRNWILCIYCCRVCTMIVSQWCSGKHARVLIQRSGIVSPKGEIWFAFNVWYSESFAKENNGGRHITPHFIFMVWSAVVVGGWLMVAWGRKSYLGPAEISSIVCDWLNSKMRDAGWFACICLAKPGVRWEHVIIQLSWIAAWLVVTWVCPVYLVDKLIVICFVPLPPIVALTVAPLTFFKDNIMLHYSPEMKCHQGFTTKIGY